MACLWGLPKANKKRQKQTRFKNIGRKERGFPKTLRESCMKWFRGKCLPRSIWGTLFAAQGNGRLFSLTTAGFPHLTGISFIC
jgi:hypothetical protein